MRRLVWFVLAALAFTATSRAYADDVDLLHAVATDVAVSSTYRNQASQLDSLVDGDLETAWNSRSGELTTSWIEVRIPASAHVSSIAMTAGFTHVTERRVDLFPGNHRVRRVRVSRDGTVLGEHTLDVASRALQSLPVTGGGGVYRLEIVETTPGTRTDWREVCISELRVMGSDPSARPGQRTPRLAVGTLPAPRTSTPADRAALLAAHRQRVSAFERSWISLEQNASSPRTGSAPEEDQWPTDMQSLVRTRRTALTALADYVAPVDEILADALRSAAARRVPLEWPSEPREQLLRDDLAAISRAMDALHAFLADDEARCRWARSLGLVHLTRAAMLARGEASFADQEHSESMDTGEPLTARAHHVDAFYRLSETLSDAEREWSRNTRGVAARLRRVTPPADAVSAHDLTEVLRQLDVAQHTCGWPAP